MVGTFGDRSGHRAGERGDIVLGWLTRLVVALGVVAVLGFDAVQVGLANVQLQDQANEAATAARDAYGQHHDVTAALAAAQTSAHDANPDDVIVKGSLSVGRDGSVSLQLTRPIHTVVAHYLPVESFKTVTSGGSAAANP
jgi:hypothetical protein